MSLHSAADTTKKVFVGICFAIGGLLLLSITFTIIQGLLPKKEIPPTVSFGKLPQINFSQPVKTASVEYVLDTLSGTFPTFPTQEPVYTITQLQPELLALQNAKALVPTGDFPNDPQALSETVYQWTSPNPPYKILTYNIVTHDFNLISSYATDPDVIAAVSLGDTQGAISTAQSFLGGFNAYPKDIDESKTQTALYSINGTTKALQPAISLSTAQVIQVDFFQKDLNKLPMYYPQPNHSLINALIGAFQGGRTVLTANATIKSITTTSGTYPLKSVEQAFKELQSASPSAYVASQANPAATTVKINQMSLGYYIGQGEQKYLMPIYVFQGENGFYAYVSAITDAWIKK
ncbi:MAG TPA: hypothetical protein VLF89_01530 [Candidatus Saccharimonadales bacterium]|nr:hypothetical protein [Candidatus Saccharimonadales bacterium]